jgi:hypothetical protein
MLTYVEHMTGLMNPSGTGKPRSLYGRRGECAALDELLGQVRSGHGTVLVLFLADLAPAD